MAAVLVAGATIEDAIDARHAASVVVMGEEGSATM